MLTFIDSSYYAKYDLLHAVFLVSQESQHVVLLPIWLCCCQNKKYLVLTFLKWPALKGCYHSGAFPHMNVWYLLCLCYRQSCQQLKANFTLPLVANFPAGVPWSAVLGSCFNKIMYWLFKLAIPASWSASLSFYLEFSCKCTHDDAGNSSTAKQQFLALCFPFLLDMYTAFQTTSKQKTFQLDFIFLGSYRPPPSCS